MDLEDFKDLITTEINREKGISHRYPDNIEETVNIGLTIVLGIVIASYNNTSVNTEREFASVVVKNIEDKKKIIVAEEEENIFKIYDIEDEDKDQVDTSYVLLGMETACDIVKEMLNKINGD